MPSNRRRNANAVPLASIAAWILVCLFIGGAGLGYVWLKNDLHINAAKIKNLENDLSGLSLEYMSVRSNIVSLSSMDAISRRYHSDKTKLGGLMEIPPERIVYVDHLNALPANALPANALPLGSKADLRKIAIQEEPRP